jgi:YD repeat-containing protein
MRQYARSYTQNYVIFTDETGTQVKTSYTPLGLLSEVIDVTGGNTVLSQNTYDSLAVLLPKPA